MDFRESTGSKWERQGAKRKGSRGSSKHNAASFTLEGCPSVMTFIKCTWPKGVSQMQDLSGTLFWKGRSSRDRCPEQWVATSLPVTWLSTVHSNTVAFLKHNFPYLPSSIKVFNGSFSCSVKSTKSPYICHRPPQPLTPSLVSCPSHHILSFFTCLENQFSFQTPKTVPFPEN